MHVPHRFSGIGTPRAAAQPPLATSLAVPANPLEPWPLAVPSCRPANPFEP
jgi:hypothetical protein